MQNNVVKVLLHGEEVGRLYWDVKVRRAIFSFAPSFVTKGLDIAPLTASVKSAGIAAHPVMGNRDKIFQGLPPFIADSLPDRWGNQVFEQWAHQSNIPLHSLTPVDKLTFIGKRGMGALEFEPATEDIETSESIELNSLYLLARKIFEQREDAQILLDEELNLQSLYEVGTSAGGQHPKAIIAINKKTGEMRSGQISLPTDYTYYILKFSEDNGFPFTNIEMAYYELAKLSSIKMMPSRLLEIEGKYHFLTERYDRVEGRKVHTQTLAAMYPDATSYEDLLSVARMLDIPALEQSELFRRMAFNIFGGNVDDHIKNFSFMLDDGGKWHITPAYDLTFSVNMEGAFYENRHCLTVLGKDENISVEDMLAFAKENNIRDAKNIIEDVASAFTHFYDYAQQCHVSDYWASRIEEYISHLVPEQYTEAMTHFMPTIISPYKTQEGLMITSFKLHETKHHDFQLTAEIDGVSHTYVARRKSHLAYKIIEDGRAKMSEENIKKLIGQYLVPLSNNK